MNRAARRLFLFDRDTDYDLFLDTLSEAHLRIPIRILCYAVMGTHFHLVLWPENDDQLPRFMQWLTGTHARRWNLRRGLVGNGTVYQGRYKAIPVKDDHHFLVVCRYVERNPLKARLVPHAAEWRWSSAAANGRGPTLAPWPVPRPDDWLVHVDARELPGEFYELREAVRTGVAFGPPDWRDEMAARLDWRRGMRRRGRPRGEGKH